MTCYRVLAFLSFLNVGLVGCVAKIGSTENIIYASANQSSALIIRGDKFRIHNAASSLNGFSDYGPHTEGHLKNCSNLVFYCIRVGELLLVRARKPQEGSFNFNGISLHVSSSARDYIYTLKCEKPNVYGCELMKDDRKLPYLQYTYLLKDNIYLTWLDIKVSSDGSKLIRDDHLLKSSQSALAVR